VEEATQSQQLRYALPREEAAYFQSELTAALTAALTAFRSPALQDGSLLRRILSQYFPTLLATVPIRVDTGISHPLPAMAAFLQAAAKELHREPTLRELSTDLFARMLRKCVEENCDEALESFGE
jgi:hypothetical protein